MDVFDLVERGPNFLLPGALLMLVLYLRHARLEARDLAV